MRLIVYLPPYYALMRPNEYIFQEYKYRALVCCLIDRAVLLHCFINACTCGSIKIYKLGLIKVYKQLGGLAALMLLSPVLILLSCFSYMLLTVIRKSSWYRSWNTKCHLSHLISSCLWVPSMHETQNRGAPESILSTWQFIHGKAWGIGTQLFTSAVWLWASYSPTWILNSLI